MILDRLKLPLNDIAQLISSTSNSNQPSHTSWYVLETISTDLVTNLLTTKGVSSSVI